MFDGLITKSEVVKIWECEKADMPYVEQPIVAKSYAEADALFCHTDAMLILCIDGPDRQQWCVSAVAAKVFFTGTAC